VIRVGTAGFAYKDWEGAVYPPGVDRLAYLAGFFPCIEMNVTFYRVPTRKAVEGWLETVKRREDFRFTFKLYQGLTHGTEDDALAPFLHALAPCRDAGRLGAILLQFPFFFRNTQQSRARLSHLAGGLAGWPCAVEVRDRGWLSAPALDFLNRLGLSLASIDICQAKDSIPPCALVTGPLGYARLHGRNRAAWFSKGASRDQKYDYLYSPAELDTWAGIIAEVAAKSQQTFVITNNHFGGKAVANAFQLSRLLTGTAPEPPEHLKSRFPALHLAR